MLNNEFVYDAKLMSKGQVTIPKAVRDALGISVGDRVTFILEDGNVRILNSTLYALQKFQQQMKGQAEQAGFTSESDVDEEVTQSRREENIE